VATTGRYSVDRWHARLRDHKIARRSGRLAAISEGLRPGDTVHRQVICRLPILSSERGTAVTSTFPPRPRQID
jgi:hypothetical protein